MASDRKTEIYESGNSLKISQFLKKISQKFKFALILEIVRGRANWTEIWEISALLSEDKKS